MKPISYYIRGAVINGLISALFELIVGKARLNAKVLLNFIVFVAVFPVVSILIDRFLPGRKA